MKTVCQVTEQLQHYYHQTLQERMDGVPIVNSRLEVAALNFQIWGDYFLGVMVTPWFMNLMLVPAKQEHNQGRVGDKKIHAFPSGVYEFTLGFDTSIGYYQSCSLFSPMFEFPDQETAVETAQQVMKALMDEENKETISMRNSEVSRAWAQSKNQDTPIVGEDTTPDKNSPLLSRRELLTGVNHD